MTDVGHAALDIHDNADVLDLAMLLNDERVLEALDPSNEPEDTATLAAILESMDGGESQIDTRFDNVIDRLAVLPAAQQARALDMLEGFLLGLEIGRALETASLGAAQ